MKRGLAVLAAGIAVSCLGIWWYTRPPAPTYLVAQIDQTFEEVVKNSTYPVWERSNRPAEYPGALKAGATWVDHPSVIFKLDDATNGFSLPPTKFGAITYMDNRVQSIVTSPMLKALPYDDTLTLLQALQDMFKAKGWVPWDGDNSQWFDLSPRGRQKLQDDMYETQPGRMISLRVPKKNLEMFLSVHCENDCDDRPHSRWLINVEIGKKALYNWNGE
jgi:hypothetical protein